jgi:beta-phosphoglucomutase-like phosphatase (HAD superfamily)
MIDTIIFDFDGTLADCKELHQTAFRNAVKQLCPEAVFSNEDIEGRPTREKMRILHTMGYEFNDDKLNEIKQAYTQEHLWQYVKHNKELCDEMFRLQKKYKLCVASNATELFVYRSLEIMQLHRRGDGNQVFTKINTATDFPAKPDHYTFFDCMRWTNTIPDNTIIFEDSIVGIQWALSTGAEVIRVTAVAHTIQEMKKL